jgi:two-component system, cell cycle response regulator
MTIESQHFTVAVVDDDASIRRLVGALLAREGYQVIEASTAAEARSKLLEFPWDLVILDRRLPDEDGVALARQIKANPALRGRYVIMLTGDTEAAEKIHGFDLGADDYVTKPFNPLELLARLRAARRIVDLQKELIVSNRRLELLSITDGLTQLYNHRHFQEEFSRLFDEASRYQRPLSLALLDIDFFKKVNDTYGHAAGDVVLKEVASLFLSSIRASDLAARYGGEEFAVLMPETTLEAAEAFAETIRRSIEVQPIETEEAQIPITLSIGVSSYPHTHFRHQREMIEAADRALYRAKRGGRNRVRIERRADFRRRTDPVFPAT